MSLVRCHEESCVSEVSIPSWPNPAAEPIDRLQDLHCRVRISKQLHRKVEGIELIRLKREQRTQNLCSVLGHSFYVDCPSAVCRPINSSMNAGTASSFCKSPAIRIMAFHSGKTGLFQSFWQRWPSSKKARRSNSRALPKCWRPSA